MTEILFVDIDERGESSFSALQHWQMLDICNNQKGLGLGVGCLDDDWASAYLIR